MNETDYMRAFHGTNPSNTGMSDILTFLTSRPFDRMPNRNARDVDGQAAAEAQDQ